MDRTREIVAQLRSLSGHEALAVLVTAYKSSTLPLSDGRVRVTLYIDLRGEPETLPPRRSRGLAPSLDQIPQVIGLDRPARRRNGGRRKLA